MLVRLPVTLELIVLSMAVALAIAIPAAIIGAMRQNTWADYTATSVAMIGVSIPEFFVGRAAPARLLHRPGRPAAQLGLGLPARHLPDDGVRRRACWGNAQHVLMPAIALGIGRAAILTRLLRASMLEVIRTEYVTTARAKGLAERQVVLKHALKNALIPTVTVMGLQVGFLIGGAIVVETLFAMPGLGTFGIDAIIARDYQQVQGFALITAHRLRRDQPARGPDLHVPRSAHPVAPERAMTRAAGRGPIGGREQRCARAGPPRRRRAGVAIAARPRAAESPFAQGAAAAAAKTRRPWSARRSSSCSSWSAIFADVLAPQSPTASDQTQTFQRPSWDHPLGTDQLGRDMLSRIIHGTRISLVVGVSSVLLALFVGVPLGLIAGYYGGRTDSRGDAA